MMNYACCLGFCFQHLISVNVHGAIFPAVLMFVASSSPGEGRGHDNIYTRKGLKVVYGNYCMFLGIILETSKVQKWSMGSKKSTEGQGRPYKCDSPCVVKSAVTVLLIRIKLLVALST